MSFDELKISWAVWTCGVHERFMQATIMQKDVFDHKFWTKALKMMILVCFFWG